MKNIIFLLIAFSSMGGYASTDSSDKKPEWALKFAEAVMARSDSLIYYGRNTPKYEYDYAFLGSAIDKLGIYDKRYSKYSQAYIDYFVELDGTIKSYNINNYNIDRVRPGLNMLVLYERTGDERYKKAADTLVKQMESHPRTKTNGFWHKKRYPSQMWLDGIYMASPFLTKYAQLFDNPKWFDEVTFQIKLIYGKTLDKKTGLLYHAWDESKTQQWCNPETGQSKHFWSRATGWYIMAIVDVLDFLPETHPDRNNIIEILNNLSKALMKIQDKETGLWHQVLDMGGHERNYLEASGSAMFIYAFAKGAKYGYLPKEYLDIAHKSFDSLVLNLVKEGPNGYPTLTNTCGACGLGGTPYRMADYDYYVTEKKVDNDSKGVAPVILAAIELGK